MFSFSGTFFILSRLFHLERSLVVDRKKTCETAQLLQFSAFVNGTFDL